MTFRQRQVVALVCEGKTNKQIASELSVTEACVKFHLGNVYKELKIKNRRQLCELHTQNAIATNPEVI